MRSIKKWKGWEVGLIEGAVRNIIRGASIYSQVKLLHGFLLRYRTWDSIRSKIYRVREKRKDGSSFK